MLAHILGVMGIVLKTAEVTTPNLFSPPFNAQNRSGLLSEEAVVIVPFYRWTLC